MMGIVACEALYNVVERRQPDAPTRYVPQELHEFPMNVPLEVDVQERLQAAVDELERGDPSTIDRIVVLYATSSTDMSALQSSSVPLVVAAIDDCIDAFLDRPVSQATGESKEGGTYYLTRGTIDCGVDGYKLHEAYRGELDALVSRFDAARESHPDLRISWPDGERFATVAEQDRGLSPDRLGDTFHEILGGYDRVELVDTGDLYDVHREYAESFRSFIERLRAEHGDGHEVDLAVVDGDTSTLDRAVSDEPLETVARDDQHTIIRPAHSKG